MLLLAQRERLEFKARFKIVGGIINSDEVSRVSDSNCAFVKRRSLSPCPALCNARRMQWSAGGYRANAAYEFRAGLIRDPPHPPSSTLCAVPCVLFILRPVAARRPSSPSRLLRCKHKTRITEERRNAATFRRVHTCLTKVRAGFFFQRRDTGNA